MALVVFRFDVFMMLMISQEPRNALLGNWLNANLIRDTLCQRTCMEETWEQQPNLGVEWFLQTQRISPNILSTLLGNTRSISTPTPTGWSPPMGSSRCKLATKHLWQEFILMRNPRIAAPGLQEGQDAFPTLPEWSLTPAQQSSNHSALTSWEIPTLGLLSQTTTSQGQK